MTTKRETILQAITTALAAVPGVTGVYRSREDAMSREESPAVALSWVQEVVRQVTIAYVEKDLDVQVGVYARGAVPDQLADPVVQAVHAAMMADATLGGLAMDTTEGGTTSDLEDADQTACWITMRYRVWYRHSPQSLAA